MLGPVASVSSLAQTRTRAGPRRQRYQRAALRLPTSCPQAARISAAHAVLTGQAAPAPTAGPAETTGEPHGQSGVPQAVLDAPTTEEVLEGPPESAQAYPGAYLASMRIRARTSWHCARWRPWCQIAAACALTTKPSVSIALGFKHLAKPARRLASMGCTAMHSSVQSRAQRAHSALCPTLRSGASSVGANSCYSVHFSETIPIVTPGGELRASHGELSLMKAFCHQ